MGTVTNLNPAKDIGEFCDFLFGVEDGFVYLPSKDPESGTWFTDFHPWPRRRTAVINSIQLLSKTREIYIAPVLYSEPNADATQLKGASVVWAEFDGKVPTGEQLTEKGSPPPTVRIKSSKTGHEHWYWKLDKFSTDLKSIQDTNRALAYALGADPSGWDIEQVLRPVGSLNHKRGQLPVALITNTRINYSFNEFDSVPHTDSNVVQADFNTGAIPNANDVLLKYAWISTERELIRSKAEEGQRSSMLTKLGYICCEKGLDNSETYSILEWVDQRWGKFANRTNKKQCYIRLIDFCRQKHPYKEDPVSPEDATPDHYEMVGFVTHFRDTEKAEWIIEGLLHDTAILYLVGRAGSLKTAFAMELGIKLALNQPVLSWKKLVDRPLKIGMFSLEMNGPEVQIRQEKIMARSTEDELDLMETNFKLYTKQESMRLFDVADAERFKNTILRYKLDGIIIDSASLALANNMSDEDVVKKATTFLQRLRNLHKFFVIMIHHPRKNPAGVRDQKMTLNDLFGSQNMETSATTVLGMSLVPKKNEEEAQLIEFMHLKTRFSEVPPDYRIQLNKEDFTFSRPVIPLGDPSNPEFDALQELANKMDEDAKKKNGRSKGVPGLSF